MRGLKTIAREVLGLFVDDGAFAVAILAWLLVAGLVGPHLPIPAVVKGPMLFAGLAAILVESAVRRARRGDGGFGRLERHARL
jgi:hypothetical protein